jgi:hypothetical protein
MFAGCSKKKADTSATQSNIELPADWQGLEDYPSDTWQYQ